jgi:nitrogen fixation NifU-like protein
MNSLYQEELMEHYKYPQNRGELEKPDFTSNQVNPSCGDVMRIDGKISDHKLDKVFFQGKGCVISQAAASMLTEHCTGKQVEDVMQLNHKDIVDLIGIELGPVRLKCATLSLEALKKGILSYSAKKQHSTIARTQNSL